MRRLYLKPLGSTQGLGGPTFVEFENRLFREFENRGFHVVAVWEPSLHWLPWTANTTGVSTGISHFLSPSLFKWGGYCEGLFEDLAKLAPRELADLVSGDVLKPTDLTFAAEILGSVNDRALVVRTLLPLLDHASALVREGAVYGLSGHMTPEVTTRLRQVVALDPSHGVSTAAREALEANA